ncbi:hypothetical protein MTR67_040265 [Solanum verrucosum]|uniref:Reverse transcriptase zinc-binding domain-containing protein n=1 Tax=Solanum verrucosum TaxID=315347 RepID=A0AAF0ZRI2_SOLVR|nr:hypothetical protein MTR67_040265 [Solanum verrucosum]
MEFSKEELMTVPIWIKLPRLDFNYWSAKGLSKTGSLVGKPLMVDKHTEKKLGLSFARLLVEVKVGNELSEEVMFRNEKGVVLTQKAECRKLNPIPKSTTGTGVEEPGRQQEDKGREERFEPRRVQCGNGKQRVQDNANASIAVVVNNSFQSLTQVGEEEMAAEQVRNVGLQNQSLRGMVNVVCWNGHDASVKRVGEVLLHFSRAIGLRANSEKSSIYLAGVKDDMRQRLLELTGLELGKFLMRIAIPKHRFILWLAEMGRLLTKDRLHKMGLDKGNQTCVLCNRDMAENAEHLFSQCVCIMEVWNEMQIWTGIRMHIQGVQLMLKGINQKHWTRFRKEVIAADLWSYNLLYLAS